MPKVSLDSPQFAVLSEIRQVTHNLVLVDLIFDVATHIDALFEGNIMAAVLLGELVPLRQGLPVTIATHFRFVITDKTISLSCSLAYADGLTGFPGTDPSPCFFTIIIIRHTSKSQP